MLFKKWRKEKKPPTVIKVNRYYNGGEFDSEFVTSPADKTNEIINHVKNHHCDYQQQEIERYNLDGVPEIKLEEEECGYTEDGLLIVATVSYSYRPNSKKITRRTIFSKVSGIFLLKTLCLVWIFSSIITFISVLATLL